MKEENISAIKDACGKALGYENLTFRQDIDYTLAHVLLAIIIKQGRFANAGKMFDHLVEGYFLQVIRVWNLHFDDLTEQSDSTLEFLANLLK